MKTLIFNTEFIPAGTQKAIYEYWCKDCKRKDILGCELCFITDELYELNKAMKNQNKIKPACWCDK